MEPVRPHSTPTAHRRQRQIEDCLFENLLHTPYPSISVSDICRQVGISRKAYYNYYRDKDSCLCAIIDRTFQEAMLHTTSTAPGNATELEYCIIMLEYWKEQKSLYDVLLRNNLMHFLLLRSLHYVTTEEFTILDLLNTTEAKADPDILCCFMSSQITLMMQWYYRNFDTPTEEMAKKYLRLTHVITSPEAK